MLLFSDKNIRTRIPCTQILLTLRARVNRYYAAPTKLIQVLHEGARGRFFGFAALRKTIALLGEAVRRDDGMEWWI